MRLKDKVAIITGSTDGIGRETAILFAREGAKVVVVGRREALGNEIVDEIIKENGTAIFVKTDITKEEDCNNLVNTTVKAFGKLDILVNNAAAHWLGTVMTAKPEDYDYLFSVNVKGFGMCSKAAIPYLRKEKTGNIVNVSSVNGYVGLPYQSLYNATKAAIIQLSNSMSVDFPEIRINTVLPGFTKTPSLEGAFTSIGLSMEEGCEILQRGVVMGRCAEPIEVAYAILFIASDEASYITGSSLLVDGGISASNKANGPIVYDPRMDEATGRNYFK